MMSCGDSEKLGLSASSKKIRKTIHMQPKEYFSAPDTDDMGTKKYRTYTKSQKAAIVEDLRRTFKPYFEGKSYSTGELIDHLDSLNKQEYNEIIERILAVHAPASLKGKKNKAKWQRDLKQWRRQLKSWLKSAEKPEKRGSIRVVSSEKTEEFKQRLTAILKTMSTRSFELLRSKAIDALEEMHNNRNPGQPFNRNTFSKHFWYDFKRAHPDIDALYESIPIARSNWRKSPRIERTSSDSTAKASEFKQESSDQFSGLSEHIPLTAYYQSFVSEFDSFKGNNQVYWPDSSWVEQNFGMKKEDFLKEEVKEEIKEEIKTEIKEEAI